MLKNSLGCELVLYMIKSSLNPYGRNKIWSHNQPTSFPDEPFYIAV